MSEIVIELKSHINELQFSVELRTANHKQSVSYSLAAVARFFAYYVDFDCKVRDLSEST